MITKLDFLIAFAILAFSITLMTLIASSIISEKVSELYNLRDQMKEYQVELDMDTVRVFQYGRYVDCYIIENDQLNEFDEICALDNR